MQTVQNQNKTKKKTMESSHGGGAGRKKETLSDEENQENLSPWFFPKVNTK